MSGRDIRSSAGFTLIEVMIVMLLGIILLTATLVTFDGMQRSSRDNTRRTDSTEMARRGLDVEARQLRNLAKRVTAAPVIKVVGPYDFVFQTSDPTRTWVRYCLDSSTPTRGKLWESTLSVANPNVDVTIAGMSGDCPGTGWTRTRVVADYVVNRINSQNRPVFNYTCIDGGTSCTGGATANMDKIINVESQLFVDTTPNKVPPELSVTTGVYMRNQNQVPTASILVTPLPSPARTVILNASGSNDYEGRTLSYFWFKGTMPSNIRCDQARPTTSTSSGTVTKTLWGGNEIGEGVDVAYTFPASDGNAPVIGLVVCDPGDRYDYKTQTVVLS